MKFFFIIIIFLTANYAYPNDSLKISLDQLNERLQVLKRELNNLKKNLNLLQLSLEEKEKASSLKPVLTPVLTPFKPVIRLIQEPSSEQNELSPVLVPVLTPSVQVIPQLQPQSKMIIDVESDLPMPKDALKEKASAEVKPIINDLGKYERNQFYITSSRIRENINKLQIAAALQEAVGLALTYDEEKKKYESDKSLTPEKKIKYLQGMQKLLFLIESAIYPIMFDISDFEDDIGLKESFKEKRSDFVKQLYEKLSPPQEVVELVATDFWKNSGDDQHKPNSWGYLQSRGDIKKEKLIEIQKAENSFIKKPLEDKLKSSENRFKALLEKAASLRNDSKKVPQDRAFADNVRLSLNIIEDEVKTREKMLGAFISYLSHAQKVIKRNLKDAFSWYPVEMIAQSHHNIDFLKQIESDKKRVMEDRDFLIKNQWMKLKIAINEIKKRYEENDWIYEEPRLHIKKAKREELLNEVIREQEKLNQQKEEEWLDQKAKKALKVGELLDELTGIIFNEQLTPSQSVKYIHDKLEEFIQTFKKERDISFYYISNFIEGAISKVAIFFRACLGRDKPYIEGLKQENQASLYAYLKIMRDKLFTQEPFSIIFTDPQRIKKYYITMRRNFWPLMRKLLLKSETNPLFEKNIDFLSGFPRHIVGTLWNQAIKGSLGDYKPVDISDDQKKVISMLDEAINRDNEQIGTEKLQDLSEMLEQLLIEKADTNRRWWDTLSGFFRDQDYRYKAKKLDESFFEVIVKAMELVWKARSNWPKDQRSQEYLKNIRDVLSIIKYDKTPKFPEETQKDEF